MMVAVAGSQSPSVWPLYLESWYLANVRAHPGSVWDRPCLIAKTYVPWAVASLGIEHRVDSPFPKIP